MFTFFAFVAIAVLTVQLMDTRSRLKRAEEILEEAAKRIGALQRHAGLLPPKPGETVDPAAWQRPAAAPAPVQTPVQAPVQTPVPAPAPAPRPAQTAPAAYRPPVVKREPELPQPAPAPAAPVTGTAAKAPSEPEVPAPGLATRFEILFGKQLPIWAGGITLAIAGVLIVKYAIDAGFFARIFTHDMQVVTGLLFGAGLIGGAELAWRNEDRVQDPRVPQALSGAGIASLYASVLVAANVYHLIGAGTGFLGLSVITAAALGLSLRFGAPSAVLGLVGGLAAPALVGSGEPNVPLLAVDLALTIAGLVGVSRQRRWPWLALAALLGGASWSLWLVLSAGALDTLSALSTGGLILVLALALPALALEGPRRTLLRTASACVGAAQLALLVALGGFQPLHWGLFALIAVAGQVLARRDRAFAMVPPISLALSVLLLALWSAPTLGWFTGIAVALAAIHAGPLLARVWKTAGDLKPAIELSGLALAAPALTWWHYPALADGALAGVATGAAALLAAALGLGWQNADRKDDLRFAGLTAATSLLLALAGLLLAPHWAAPLVLGALALGLLQFGQTARDPRIEPIAAATVCAGLLALLATVPLGEELPNLLAGADAGSSARSLLRWGGMALVLMAMAVRSRRIETQGGAQVLAALLGYGFAAQVLPASLLVLAPAVAASALILTLPRLPAPRVLVAAATFGGLGMAWAAGPLGVWTLKAVGSVAALPMTIDNPLLGLDAVLRRLILPTLLIGLALRRERSRLAPEVLQAGAIAGMLIGGVVCHVLYRLAFAALFGSDFTGTGMAQRLGWEALLLGAGYLLMQRRSPDLARPLLLAGTVHALVYTGLLHNPLWAEQAVGGWPLANLLVPAFAVVPLGLALFVAAWPERPALFDRLCEFAQMAAVCLIGWATLRQVFHGTLLTDPGVYPAENILRSLLLLALAIGFLLWGIRRARHDWRIASLVLMLGAVGKVFLFDASGLEGLLRIGSFVALGFSLIGIGWLYSRQLMRAPLGSAEEEPRRLD